MAPRGAPSSLSDSHSSRVPENVRSSCQERLLNSVGSVVNGVVYQWGTILLVDNEVGIDLGMKPLPHEIAYMYSTVAKVSARPGCIKWPVRTGTFYRLVRHACTSQVVYICMSHKSAARTCTYLYVPAILCSWTSHQLLPPYWITEY